MTEINYLAPCIKIEGAPASSVKKCEGGGFANVKFEACGPPCLCGKNCL